jgi:dephospho-CoA kinase
VRVIGLTGGIGTGKSTVAAALAALGAEVIDADQEGHRSYIKGSIGWRRLSEMFGDGILDSEGEIDREVLGKLVFSNPQAMALLNATVHPLIGQRLKERLAEARLIGTEIAVVDAAVLYQAGWDEQSDEVWVVTAPVDAVVSRLVEQRGLEGLEAHRRIDTQGSQEQAIARADVVIDNDGSIEDLTRTVDRVWKDRNLPVRQQRT